MATQYRFTFEQGRRQQELEEIVAKLESEFKTAAANTGVQAVKMMRQCPNGYNTRIALKNIGRRSEKCSKINTYREAQRIWMPTQRSCVGEIATKDGSLAATRGPDNPEFARDPA